MSDHHNQEPVDLNLLEEMGYERSDVNVSQLSKSTAWFFIISTLIMFVGVLAMWRMAPHMTFGAPKERLEERRNKPGPEQPLIQSNATAQLDMTEFAAKQEEAITGYGWTDRKKGYVRIPVEDAMKRVLAKGLPSNPTTDIEVPK